MDTLESFRIYNWNDQDFTSLEFHSWGVSLFQKKIQTFILTLYPIGSMYGIPTFGWFLW